MTKVEQDLIIRCLSKGTPDYVLVSNPGSLQLHDIQTEFSLTSGNKVINSKEASFAVQDGCCNKVPSSGGMIEHESSIDSGAYFISLLNDKVRMITRSAYSSKVKRAELVLYNLASVPRDQHEEQHSI